MEESSRVYRPDAMHGMRRGEKYSNGSVPVPMGRDVAVAGDLARIGQRDGWDQAASYRENLGFATTELKKYGRGTTGPELLSRVTLDGESQRHNLSNPLDMTLSRSHQYFGFPEQQIAATATSRTQQNFRSDPSPSSYNSRGSQYSKSRQNTEYKNHRGAELLLEAVQKQDLAEITRLLREGVDLNGTEAGATALHLAAQSGDVDVIKFLLKRGANVNVRDRNGQTPEYYSKKHNISLENLQQSLRSAGVRNNSHRPTSDWLQSYQSDSPITPLPNYVESHSSPRSLPKGRYPRNSPILDGSRRPYPGQEKSRDEHRGASEQHTPVYNSYDCFPRPFEHMLRPTPSAGLPPGIEMPMPSELSLSHANGPKTYRVTEQVRKCAPEPGNVRSSCTSLNVVPTEVSALPPSEPKKLSFSIDDITRGSTQQSPMPSGDSGNRTNVSKQSVDHQLLLSMESRLSPFPVEYYSLPTQSKIDTKSRLSVANPLPTGHPIPYLGFPPHHVSSPIMSMLYTNPYITPPTFSLPISGHSGQVPACQSHSALLHQQFAPATPFQRSVTNDVGGKFVGENLGKAIGAVARSQIDDRRKLISEREKKTSDVRDTLDKKTAGNSNPYPGAPSSPAPAHKFSLRPEKPVSDPAVSSRAFSSRPFVTAPTILEKDKLSFNDVDMRIPRKAESLLDPKDTDMRPFLNRSNEPSLSSAPSKQQSKKAAKSDPSAPPHRFEQDKASSDSRREGTATAGGSASKVHRDGFRQIKHNASSAPNSTSTSTSSTSEIVRNRIKRKYFRNALRHNELQSGKEASRANEEGKPIAGSQSRKATVQDDLTSSGKAQPTESEVAPKLKDDKSSARVTTETVNATKKPTPFKSKPEANKAEPKPRGRKPKKRKLSSDASNATEQGRQPSLDAEEANESKINFRLLSSDNDAGSRREKRRKRSEPEDEYVYEWYDDFSSEPENDDSEDEDFHCPLQKTAAPARGRGKRLMRRQPARQSCRSVAGSFFESSGDERLSDDDKNLSMKKRRGREPMKTSPGKRGPKPGHRALGKPIKSRKLMSDSGESECSAFGKLDKVRKMKRRGKLPSSDKDEKEEDVVAEKRVIKRGRWAKKHVEQEVKTSIRKQDQESTETALSPPKTSKNEKLKSQKTPVKMKKSMSKDDPTVKQAPLQRALSEETPKKARMKRGTGDTKRVETSSPVMEKKLNAPSKDGEKENQEVTRKTTDSVPMSETHKAEAEDISCSLIDLYKGKHKPSSQSNNDLAPSATIKETCDLFGAALTETEAQALNAAIKTVSVAAESPHENEKTDESKSIPPHSPIPDVKPVVSAQQPIVSVPQNISVQQEAVSEQQPVLSADQSSPVRIGKKRGRKPKKASQSPGDEGKSSPMMKKIKLERVNDDNSPDMKPQSKYKLGSPTAGSDSELIARPRKGRPPGSVNKNKLKKLTGSVNKKIGRKSYMKVATKLSKINASLPRPGPTKNNLVGRSSLTTKILSRPGTPLLVRSSDKKARAASPSPAHNTPLSVKSLASNPSSRPSTPLNHLKGIRTPNPSPLPPNMKKLTCNSAIGETVLHKAVRLGYMENILYYLEHGYDANTKDNAGYTALHEACVRGRVDAVRLLLEFGADVNINSEEGTRPIHDAVEYDHVEVTRLLLACGADPKLSKFSGRGIKDMIHGNTMRGFLTAYLCELKPIQEDEATDVGVRKWDMPASAIFDPEKAIGCDVLRDPPDEDSLCDEMEFELWEEAPPDAYLLQPTENSCRSNFFLLSELLRERSCSRGEFLLNYPADVKCAEMKRLVEDAEQNWFQKKTIEGRDGENLMELISSETVIGSNRVFKVDSGGKVSLASSSARRSKPTDTWHPRGAYCERRKFFDNRANRKQSPSLNADAPSCSKSPVQSGGEKSPASCASGTNLSGVTPLTTAPLDELKDDDSPASNNLPIRETNLNTFSPPPEDQPPTLQNGISDEIHIVEQPTILPLDTGAPEPNKNDSFSSFDLAPYSPTSDLRPATNDIDPTRTRTETENAVYNLMYDALPYRCQPRSEAAKQFVHFNNISKSPKPPNHVTE